jgi:hypothetical protein
MNKNSEDGKGAGLTQRKEELTRTEDLTNNRDFINNNRGENNRCKFTKTKRT